MSAAKGHMPSDPAPPARPTTEILDAVAREIIRLDGTNPVMTRIAPPAQSMTQRSRVHSSGASLVGDAEQFLRLVSDPAHHVGRMPPEPPTLRARVGSLLVRLFKRALFWYSIQINEINVRVASMLGKQAEYFVDLSRRLDLAREEHSELKTRLDSALSTIDLLDERQRKFERGAEDAVSRLSELITDVSKLRSEWEISIRDVKAQTAERLEAITTAGATADAEAARLRQQVAEVGVQLRNTELFARQTRAALSIEQSRIGLLMRERGGRPSAPHEENAASEHPTGVDLGALYFEFENAFRGSRGEIKQRAAEHLERMRDRNLGTANMPVLDLGCGRGEWLEVMRENGLLGAGVESHPSFVEECRSRGLMVHQADILTFLQSQPPQSHGAITAFHVIEHLPFKILLDLLDSSLRVLKPGGMLLLETPNPANLTVGANTFYLDPSHIRPLPAELMRFIVEARGFSDVEIIPLHPVPECYRLDDKDSPSAALLNHLVFGARDYAVVAVRP